MAFSAGQVQKQARALAAEKFVPPKIDLAKERQELSYDQYRDIRFKREQAIWASKVVPFRLEPLHRGFIIALLVVFTITFVWIALPFVNGLIGLVVRWCGRGVGGKESTMSICY